MALLHLLNEYSTILGALAATLTTLCFVPQAIKVVREKDTKALSLSMYLMFITGVFFWLLYGITLNSWPMIAANLITFALALLILITKIRYG